ncbi:YegP family protein [Arthrobacter sp. UYCu712]|uniref:YegP family protein n=1 Tax=Arthrobacter sp. UYCu712 TaxID=3156340 RepID=UPI00339531AA
MTGTFELFTDDNQHFRFRLKAPDGTLMALSRSFPDKAAAVAGITAVREYAGMGLITDLCPDIPVHNPSAQAQSGTRPTAPPAVVRPAAAPQPRTGTGAPVRPRRQGRTEHSVPGRYARVPTAA